MRAIGGPEVLRLDGAVRGDRTTWPSRPGRYNLAVATRNGVVTAR
jgi:hypothetical protein